MTTTPTRTTFQFPGHGAHLAGSLTGLIHDYPQALDILETVDKVVAEYGITPISPFLTDPRSPTFDDLAVRPDTQHATIFTTSVCLLEILREEGLKADVVVGHSGGEIASLVAAAALTLEDATRIVCERSLAVCRAGLPPGGMLAVEASATRTAHLLAAIDDWTLAIAAHNAPFQTIVSGLDDGLTRLEAIATQLDLRSTRLPILHPYHNPLLARAVAHFTESVKDLPVRAPTRRVYSPILGRYITTEQDVRQQVISHFNQPIHYLEALRELHADGVNTFVEVGARQALTRMTALCLPPGIQVAAPLARRITIDELRELLAALREGREPPKLRPNRLTDPSRHTMVIT
jgi:[acyl-carrier-protein] S-malonyltransferase